MKQMRLSGLRTGLKAGRFIVDEELEYSKN